jgi:LDH2 family malate/lactate/ureidoglycolate dehydrogenase
MRFSEEVLSSWARRLLEAAEVSPSAAATVAEVLVEANLRGVDSHGVLRLPVYLRRIRAGLVNPAPHPRVAKQDGPVALVDGDRGPGPVAAVFAATVAAETAESRGVGFVGVFRSSHFGMAAAYAVRIARRGLVALVTSNAEPDMVPYGGARKAIGTNPLAFAAPAPMGPMVLDMATSHVAMGKVFLARERGERIPEGWAVDADGRSVTDPGQAIAAVPLGGAKGYGLALMVEILSGVLTGAGITHGIGRMYDEWDRPQDVGHAFFALNPEYTIGRDAFLRRMAPLWDELKAVPPAAGFDEVCLPGELEMRTEAVRRREGIPLADRVCQDLVTLSRELGVEIPSPC